MLPPLRLLTINLLHGGFLPWFREDRARTAARLDLLAEALARLRPDVIAVQEALVASHRSVATWLGARLGHEVRFATANPSIVPPPVSDRIPPPLRARIDAAIKSVLDFEEGLAVLTAFPVLAHTAHELPRPRFALENRVALRVRVATPGGRPVDVWNVHLTRAGGGHDRQSAALGRLVLAESRDVPALVLGDFNVDDRAKGVEMLRAAGFADAYRRAQPSDPGLTAWQRVDTAEPTVSRRVDYCWLGPHAAFDVVRSEVVLDRPGRGPDGRPLWPSDHYGILTELAG